MIVRGAPSHAPATESPAPLLRLANNVCRMATESIKGAAPFGNAGGSIPERLFPKRTPSIPRTPNLSNTFPDKEPFEIRTRPSPHGPVPPTRRPSERAASMYETVPYRLKFHPRARGKTRGGGSGARSSPVPLTGAGKTSGAYSVLATVSIPPRARERREEGSDKEEKSLKRKGGFVRGKGTFSRKVPFPSPMFFRRIYLETTPVRGLP